MTDLSKESVDYFGLNIPFMQCIGLQPEKFSRISHAHVCPGVPT